jgi:hypothetical protein
MNITTGLKKSIPLVAGGVLGNFASNMAGKFIANEKLRTAAVLALGIMLAGTKKTEAIGNGVIVSAGTKLVGSFVPALAGYDDLDFTTVDGVLAGEEDVLNGTFDPETGEEY